MNWHPYGMLAPEGGEFSCWAIVPVPRVFGLYPKNVWRILFGKCISKLWFGRWAELSVEGVLHDHTVIFCGVMSYENEFYWDMGKKGMDMRDGMLTGMGYVYISRKAGGEVGEGSDGEWPQWVLVDVGWGFLSRGSTFPSAAESAAVMWEALQRQWLKWFKSTLPSTAYLVNKL